MLNTIIKNHKNLTNILDVISSILESSNLIFTKEGLKISGMDISHVSLLKFHYYIDDFDKYEFDNEKNIYAGINLSDLVKILKLGDINETLMLDISNEEQLNINFNGNGLNKQFSLKLIELDRQEMNIPNIEFDLIMNISSKIFTNILNSLLITDTDSLKFSINDDKLSLSSDGIMASLKIDFLNDENKSKSKKLKITKKDKKITEIDEIDYKLHKCNGNFNSSFSINLLKKILKANQIIPDINCYLSPQTPLKLDYKLTSNNSRLEFYLSPKCDEY